MIRHIPLEPVGCSDGCWITYCGRRMQADRCINLKRDCIEDAECKSCQRSDDRRVQEWVCRKKTPFGTCTFLPGHKGPCEGER